MPDPMSPSAVVAHFAKFGIEISERELRAKARRIGAYRQTGRAMYFLPADIERIMEPECSNPSKEPAARSGSRAARSTVLGLNEARERIRSSRRGA